MLRHEYDEDDAIAWRLDVSRADEEWAEAVGRLEAVQDPLVRRLVALHRDCDAACTTLPVIARHYGIDLPPR